MRNDEDIGCVVGRCQDRAVVGVCPTDSAATGSDLLKCTYNGYDRRVTLRITEAELARDIHAVLAKVQEGVEVIVEQDHRPVAVIKTPPAPGRKISECIVLAKAYEEKLGYAPVPDPDFAGDVQAAIDVHSEPLNPPSWD